MFLAAGWPGRIWFEYNNRNAKRLESTTILGYCMFFFLFLFYFSDRKPTEPTPITLKTKKTRSHRGSRGLLHVSKRQLAGEAVHTKVRTLAGSTQIWIYMQNIMIIHAFGQFQDSTSKVLIRWIIGFHYFIEWLSEPIISKTYHRDYLPWGGSGQSVAAQNM